MYIVETEGAEEPMKSQNSVMSNPQYDRPEWRGRRRTAGGQENAASRLPCGIETARYICTEVSRSCPSFRHGIISGSSSEMDQKDAGDH